MEIKEKDFVEIEYTGTITDDAIIFDTTSEEVAKKNGLYEQEATYGPIIICVGEGHLLKGLDKALLGRETEKPFTIELSPEEGFGKKSAKLLKLVPASVFKKQDITIMPGLQVNMDGLIGTIKTVSGGRVIVDFNHPLSGKKLTYTITIKREVTEPKEQLEALAKMLLQQKAEAAVGENKATLKLDHGIPTPMQEEFAKKAMELTGLKELNFEAKEAK